MKKVLYLYDQDESHISVWAKSELETMFEGDGRFSFVSEAGDKKLTHYDAVIVFLKKFSSEQVKKLDEYAGSGGMLLFVNPSAEISNALKEITGCNGLEDRSLQQFTVFVEEKNHYITQRFPSEFQINDFLLDVKSTQSKVIFSTYIGNRKVPVVSVREYKKGLVCCIFAGGTRQTWKNFDFRKIVIRCIAWMLGEKQKEKTIHCGLVGYGPMFGMGKGHATWINSTSGMKTVAVCDTNPERVNAARQELPDLLGYFTNPEEMLKMKEIDLVVGIVPHNVHFEVAMKSFAYGKHVILEKPFCISVEEANKMIETARKNKLMLSVFHNRRWDGDYIAIKNLVNNGLIGDIFHIECFIGNYAHPRYWWRSDKKISGGVMHDWGAHFIDWILNLVPSKITGISGDFQKRVWFSVSNEDHGQALIKFENGVTADFMISSITAINKPKWKIFGTKGAIEVNWDTPDRINVVSFVSGVRQEGIVKIIPSYGHTEYYRNIADHLLMEEELIVKPEQSRRVIGVIEAAEKASKLNKILPPFENCE
ncbi:MAG TPA: Gfo/Idh/MocA family oxidoreductase [bacterium]|nr:Gfo/Idh/MocA family oxidoreductase [bacterium]HOL35224.1 Gfo/Idh/MocA family oxidoreductase [bacterium]HPP08213.1 Gfo/Idh/MocA family oxidoreductase [bacterium]